MENPERVPPDPIGREAVDRPSDVRPTRDPQQGGSAMSNVQPAPEPIVTVAMKKLQALLKTSTASVIARKVGSTPNTVRNVAHGFSRPKAETVERYRQLGVEPSIGSPPSPVWRAERWPPASWNPDETISVRRVLLSSVQKHLYYRYVDERDELTVLAVWGARRGRGPKL
jgi:hypothetical protein